MENLIRKTSPGDRRLAKSIMQLLKRHSSVALTIDRKQVKLPKGLVKLLTQIFSMIADNKSVAVLAAEMEVTTQDAADILNFSRPYVVRLLEEGKIPFRKVGKHRRMRLADVLAYDKKVRRQMEKGLKLLTQQAQDLKWGYV
ncbi:MAG: excisionase family DNA-binding protein [Bacteroidota bacterium]